MLINYTVVAFISLLVPVVIFLILFKRRSIEQNSIIKKFEQKIDKLVDDQNRALEEATLSLTKKEKELQGNQNKLIGVQEDLKKHKILFKRRSIEQNSIIKKFEQKIDKLVDDQNRALEEATLSLTKK
ncbi:MAG: hypothetical protein D3910_23435, partial [Candidatus Electrothrix sp. ATG2]|nr:hypothetical protein [Candidatus Electrothrix sp. ATG2]